VKIDRHSFWPGLLGFAKIPLFRVKAASRNLVPFGDRRGSAAGRFGSRKQTCSFAELNAASGPVVWST
jgi:hypothetical protein